MRPTLAMIAGIVLLTAAACGGGTGGGAAASPSASPAGTAVNTCAKAHQSKHLAYLVVQHMSGQAIERCAGFDGDTIDGATVMQATGIQFQAGTGAVCQIDHEPLQFSDCTPAQPHWSLWLYTAGAWSAATTPYARLQLHDRDALGWRYVTTSDAQPPPMPQPL
jgi:hypothetical protein